MNHYDAHQILGRWAAGLPVGAASVDEASKFLESRGNKAPVVEVRPPPSFYGVLPPMSALCECGARYGMHRVTTLTCPNPAWRIGNGQPQWLDETWKRK